MKTWFIHVYIASGLVFGLIVTLIILCYCVKKRLCCCQKQSENDAESREVLLDSFPGDVMTDDEGHPYLHGSTQELLQPYSLTNVLSDSDAPTSDFSGDDVLADLPKTDLSSQDILAELPKTYMSVRTYADSVGTDSQIGSEEILGKYSKIKKDVFVDGCKLKVTLLYSKIDLFLMLSINELTGMPNKQAGGHDFVRVSIALLPEKKYRSKTRLQYVTDDLVIFGESFKFSNVTRETLFTTAFRFRLYAKKKVRKEVCIGEMVVQLADVAQRSGGFVTWKNFQRRR